MLDPDCSPIGLELCISNISVDEFELLYEDMSPELESLRIKIDFQNTHVILKRPTETHECGVIGWAQLTPLLSQMDMPSFLRELITWSKGQADSALPPISSGGKRTKSPDCSLGPADQALPTLVLETGYSEPEGGLHNDATTWLVRLIRDGVTELEDHAVQCVVLLKVSKKLAAYCQKFRDARLAPGANEAEANITFPEGNAIVIEVWRNSRDPKTGGFIKARTPRGRKGQSIPVCISCHTITLKDLFEIWIPEFQEQIARKSSQRFETLQDLDPIPRSVVGSSPANGPYFTLYLDDLLPPADIPKEVRGTVWVNIPVKLWIWACLRSYGVGFIAARGFSENSRTTLWEEWKSRNKENQDKSSRHPLTELEGDGGQGSSKRLKTH